MMAPQTQTPQPQIHDADPPKAAPTAGDDLEKGTVQVVERTEEDEGRAYVKKYDNPADFPFEPGETVWIMKPGYRAPVGTFEIVKAHPHDFFELKDKQTGAAHTELVEGKYLIRQ